MDEQNSWDVMNETQAANAIIDAIGAWADENEIPAPIRTFEEQGMMTNDAGFTVVMDGVEYAVIVKRRA
jgi:hypothetical protein